MRKFSIKIWRDLAIWYSHYLSDKFIKERECYNDFKENYPLGYSSRRFDKPARKHKNGTCGWVLDGKDHRIGKPAWIYPDGSVRYYENGERVE